MTMNVVSASEDGLLPTYQGVPSCSTLRHVSISSGIVKIILQRTVKEKRRSGRQKNRWENNIKDRERWKGTVATSSAVP